jgi:hypothetical protein
LGHPIRQSQFILTYGVGSIVETATGGPRLILDFEHWGSIFGSSQGTSSLNSLLIPDLDLSPLLGGGKVFRIPTNAEMGLPEEQPLFATGLFPSWALCLDHKPYFLHHLDEKGRTNCPVCLKKKGRVFAQQQAIRFVRACRNGHLDDVDWQAAVHAKRKNCSGEVFEWDERGTEMKSIHLTCQACGEMSTLADVYFRNTACSGRFPEGKDYEPCDEDMYVILRNASNLRIAEIVSAITIPPRVTRLHTILQDPFVLGLLTSGERWSKSELLRGLEAQVKRRVIPPKYIDEVRQIDETQILTAIDEVLDFKGVPDEIELKEKEFRALRHAAENGAKHSGPGNRSYFEVDKSNVVRVPLGSRLHLRVCPIRTLRTVLAQRGYRRHVRGEGRLVERFLSVGQDRWYPGIELFGEGIFVDLPPDGTIQLNSGRAKLWDEINVRAQYPESNPVYVWWHTLSHRLITALAVDSGYSAASIRERIYSSGERGGVAGGVLLYATQPGGDGTLGGLIALVSEFSRIMNTALRNLASCSNDPLCFEQIPSDTHPSGAACYACLLLPETSCESHNMFLDRSILAESL